LKFRKMDTKVFEFFCDCPVLSTHKRNQHNAQPTTNTSMLLRAHNLSRSAPRPVTTQRGPTGFSRQSVAQQRPIARNINRTFAIATETAKPEKQQENASKQETSLNKTTEASSNVAKSEGKPQSAVATHHHKRMGRQYDPFFDDWRDFSRRMDKYLTSSFGLPAMNVFDWETPLISGGLVDVTDQLPSVDISESDKSYHVHADLPGVPKENIHLSVKDGVLEIKATKDFKKETKDEKRNYSLIERSYGSFVRRLPVPKDADPSKVKAKYENGVLELEIPKPEPSQREQTRIKIE